MLKLRVFSDRCFKYCNAWFFQLVRRTGNARGLFCVNKRLVQAAGWRIAQNLSCDIQGREIRMRSGWQMVRHDHALDLSNTPECDGALSILRRLNRVTRLK